MLNLFNAIAIRWGANTAWSLLSVALPLLALLAGLLAGALLGLQGRAVDLAKLRTENAELRAAHAETTRLAALAGARRLQAAQERTDALAGELLETLAANHHLTQEKTRALLTATAGRACLSDRALRLLHGSPGITVAGADGLPAPRAGTAAAGAGPAAHPHADDQGAGQPAHAAAELAATDTSVAVWIATAGEQYEACRQRLNALIAWHDKTPATPNQAPLREPAP